MHEEDKKADAFIKGDPVDDTDLALLIDQRFEKINQRFKNRFQEKKFLSPKPNLLVEEVIIRLYNKNPQPFEKDMDGGGSGEVKTKI